MSRLYIFSDEAGDFTFERKDGASNFFVVCTITMDNCRIGAALLNLRRKLSWLDVPMNDYFHATTDRQTVRDAVFETLQLYSFDIQATIMEKSKAQPNVRRTNERFYKTGWYFHAKHGIANLLKENHEIHATAAAIGVKKQRTIFKNAINDVMAQTMGERDWRANVFPAATDPCLQVADYCAWAIQKRWERQDMRSYDLIKDRIKYEYDLWGHGTKRYY